MGKIYNKNYYDKLQLMKEAQILKPLLLNLRDEEKIISDSIINRKKSA